MRSVGYHYSHNLGTNIDFVWYGDRGRPLIIFPTSGDGHLEAEERGLIGALDPAIREGRLQVICVNTINKESWSRKDLPPSERLRRHNLYDKFLAEEFVPFVVKHAHRDDIAVYGASMGGFHAVNFGARHPELVDRVIALSGLFDIKDLMKDHWEELSYYHSPVDYISNMTGECVDKMKRVDWVIATGEHDSLVEHTRRLGGLLASKGIGATVETWPGVFGHDWPFWQQHLPRFV